MTLSIKGLFGYNYTRVDALKVTAFDYTSIDIEYTVNDAILEKCKHFLHLNGEVFEITSKVNRLDNVFKYKIENLKANKIYNIQIEIKEDDVSCVSLGINQSTKKYPIYGVAVDESNSNPETSVTYIEDAVGITPANPTSYGGWIDKFVFKKNRIVGFKNGKVVKEIKKDNKTQYIDGSSVTTDVDVMTEIPKIYWKFDTIEKGYELRVSEGEFEGADCYAHKVGGVEKDFIYVGTYLGYNEGGKLRSISGVSPTVSQTIGKFREQAQAVGGGYQQFNWFTLILLQSLYLLTFKNRNSQSALGTGVCKGVLQGGIHQDIVVNTGGTNAKGMLYGSQNKREQICFLGIEDFYGNAWQFVDGIYCDGNFNIKVSKDNKIFNDNGNGFKDLAKTQFLNGGFGSKVTHTNQTGFFPAELNGSTTTHYCDFFFVLANCCAGFGGAVNNDLRTGAFELELNMKSSTFSTIISSRLVYLGE